MGAHGQVVRTYCISSFELWLSNERLVSNEHRVKRGHCDHGGSKNESQRSAGAQKFLN